MGRLIRHARPAPALTILLLTIPVVEPAFRTLRAEYVSAVWEATRREQVPVRTDQAVAGSLSIQR